MWETREKVAAGLHVLNTGTDARSSSHAHNYYFILVIIVFGFLNIFDSLGLGGFLAFVGSLG